MIAENNLVKTSRVNDQIVHKQKLRLLVLSSPVLGHRLDRFLQNVMFVLSCPVSGHRQNKFLQNVMFILRPDVNLTNVLYPSNVTSHLLVSAHFRSHESVVELELVFRFVVEPFCI